MGRCTWRIVKLPTQWGEMAETTRRVGMGIDQRTRGRINNRVHARTARKLITIKQNKGDVPQPVYTFMEMTLGEK